MVDQLNFQKKAGVSIGYDLQCLPQPNKGGPQPGLLSPLLWILLRNKIDHRADEYMYDEFPGGYKKWFIKK